MFALGVFLMSQQRSYAVDLQSFLFGDILAVQPQDLWLILALSVVVAVAVVVLYPRAALHDVRSGRRAGQRHCARRPTSTRCW